VYTSSSCVIYFTACGLKSNNLVSRNTILFSPRKGESGGRGNGKRERERER